LTVDGFEGVVEVALACHLGLGVANLGPLSILPEGNAMKERMLAVFGTFSHKNSAAHTAARAARR
jgi:hypothetical protein